MRIAMEADKKLVNAPASEAERAVRRDLAAAYRLVAMFGWDDLLATHLSAKVPGEEAFLINPLGLGFDEVTASNLVKVDLDGNILAGDYPINRAGFVIHSAVHEAREDAGSVMHLHTRDGVAVSALAEGLLPLNQTAILASATLAFHDYEGVALNDGEKQRLVADLGGKNLMFLRNHGTVSVGRSVGEAFYQLYMLEWCCTTQVRTLSMGRPLHAVDPVVISEQQALMGVGSAEFGGYADNLVWPAMLRKAARAHPDFAD